MTSDVSNMRKVGRPPTGGLTSHLGRDGKTYYSVRLTFQGQRMRVRLGPVDERQARGEMRRIMREVHSGVWSPDAPLSGTERATLAAARKAKLAASRRTGSEAYSLTRRALQALDKAGEDSHGQARRYYGHAWDLLDEAVQAIDRGIRAAD